MLLNTLSIITQGIVSNPYNNRRGKNGNSDRLYFLGFKITADGDSRREIKRHLLLGRKARQCIKNSEISLCQQRSL